MKKHALVIGTLSLTLALSACGSKNSPDPTTATETTAESVADNTTAAATASADATTAETAAEVEVDSAAGTIERLNGSTLTIMDDFDEVEKVFDISKATILNTFPLTVGDYVEITFPEDAAGDVLEALEVEVIDAILAESEDPIMIGTIQDADDDTLTLAGADGETYTFTTANAYKVSADKSLKSGIEAQVTYLGELDDAEPLMAIKIVTEDSYDSDDAKVNAFIGEVDSAQEGSVVLVSESGDYFTFISDKVDFTAFKEGDTVQVIYEGSISAKEIPATAAKAK